MGRLASLKPKIDAQPLRLKGMDRDAQRSAEQHWRPWYSTRRWRKLRWECLVRDLFTCQWPGCGRLVADTSHLVADHKVPHRGDPALFWNIANLQCLCAPCHNSAKRKLEMGQPFR